MTYFSCQNLSISDYTRNSGILFMKGRILLLQCQIIICKWDLLPNYILQIELLLLLENQMMAQPVYLSFFFRAGVEAEMLQCADFFTSLTQFTRKYEWHTLKAWETYLQLGGNGDEKCSFPVKKLLIGRCIFVNI